MVQWSVCDKCGDSFDFDAIWTGVDWLCESCYFRWDDEMDGELDREDAVELERVLEQDMRAHYEWEQIEREW